MTLDADLAKTFSQALQFPLTLFCMWSVLMLISRFSRTNQLSMRTWALVSSCMFAGLALGYFWTTFFRMLNPGNIASTSTSMLMGAAILPSMIGLMYCGYVFQELSKNPALLQDLKGVNARKLLLLTALIVLIVYCILGGIFYLRSSWIPTNIAQEVAVRPYVEEVRPQITLKHPAWGKIRDLSINNGSSTTIQIISPTATRILFKPEMLGKIINVYGILMDGREFSHAFHLEKVDGVIEITELDLGFERKNQALVEVVDDLPTVQLRMVSYPTQKFRGNDFSITQPPFHKALQPGEHRIVLTYIDEEDPAPVGKLKYHRLDYRVTVPDNQPQKLSLKEILDAHGRESKTESYSEPDFKPLKKE
jgi:hypothetical protein